MRAVHVVGGGPAGVMAALAAMRQGAPVRIFEKSAFPRHKVCGEFLSPAILPLLRRAGCGAAFLALRPAVLRSMRLYFGTRVIRHPLPEPAYGLSRYELDRLLLEHAASAGAEVVREHWSAAAPEDNVILAGGRRSIAPAGDRLFGFKTHFSGPVNDNVELYFFRNCYVGISAIENGATNVCGLAPERSSDPSAFTPAISLIATLPSPSACAHSLAPWIGSSPARSSFPNGLGSRPTRLPTPPATRLALSTPSPAPASSTPCLPANSPASPPRVARPPRHIFAIAAACFP